MRDSLLAASLLDEPIHGFAKKKSLCLQLATDFRDLANVAGAGA